MKKFKFALAVLPLITALFTGGCADMLMERPKIIQRAEGEGLLMVSLAGVNVGSGRTLLPADPQFTRYELEFFTDGTGASSLSGVGPYSFTGSTFQLPLADGTYFIRADGYNEDALVAKSAIQTVDVTAGGITTADFTLKPYMDTASSNPVPGTLSFSLNWDGLSRMPYRAELLIETYANANGDIAPGGPAPLPHTLIPPEFPSGSISGSIRLYDRASALVKLSGSLTLPPGEYRLTMSVTMDPDAAPASRLDFAHVYSNLTTPAPFYYGGGDLYISNTSPDSGASFITGFTFDETPNATTVIGSEPGLDGTRMIMIMVPSAANLTNLTPVVTTAEGSVITSPLPITQPTAAVPNPGYTQGQIDFTGPTIWTAQAKNGAVQKYTVVVSKTPATSDDAMITNFFFKEHSDIPGNIDQAAGTITVTLPFGSSRNSLTPIVTIVGKSVADSDAPYDVPNGVNPFDFSDPQPSKTFKVTSESNSVTKNYTVTVTVAGNSAAVITRFAIDGYPDRPGNIAASPDVDGYYPITVTLPYGVSLKSLTPLIQYEGQTLEPLSGVNQNFSGPVYYTVTPQSGTAKTYKVTITNDEPDKDTGIFDFRVINVPAAKVVIGQKPRQDGKIPIVIQAPFGTIEKNMVAAITLNSPASKIYALPNLTDSISGGVIPFDNGGNFKEAVYRVMSEGDAAQQDYVVVVSAGGQYYYVDGQNGDDTEPDYYNGETESRPFRTLAHAVAAAAANPSINKIFILGDLTAANQSDPDKADQTLIAADNVITLDFTSAANKTLTIASASGAALRGASGKRVLKITGDDVNLTFENISVTGGGTTGNGGGVYISGNNNKVKFSGGNITGNSAYSGGGVYIEDGSSAPGPHSEFTFMGGEISGNTAAGAATGNPDVSGMGGGGGVYVKGNSLFWLASGTISGNTTKGAGGGVLVNGSVYAGGYPPVDTDTEYGFFMSGGRIVGNKSTSGDYPHGGGGVYVARGAFEMLGGEITGNTAARQGGGVFVHWAHQDNPKSQYARFTASGDSTITGNEGVGSSKGICNRGITELMGSARSDKVYVWNYDDDGPLNPANNQLFNLAQNAQITGIVLAWSAENANVINIVDSYVGPTAPNTICTIDLESHLSGGVFAGQLEPDWLHKNVITGNNATLKKVLGITPTGTNRLPLNSFTGKPSVYNIGTRYYIKVDGSNTYGTFEKK